MAADAPRGRGAATGWADRVHRPDAPATETVAPRRLPDGLLEVRFPGDATPTLVLVEIETYPDSTADRQVLDDLILIAMDRNAVPEVLSLVLKPKGQVADTGVPERVSARGGS